MVMACVERQQDLTADGIAHIEFVRADNVAFRADAEQLRLDGIDVVFLIDLLLEDGVQ